VAHDVGAPLEVRTLRSKTLHCREASPPTEGGVFISRNREATANAVSSLGLGFAPREELLQRLREAGLGFGVLVSYSLLTMN